MGKFTEYKLQLKGLPEGSHKYEYHLGQQFFDNMENTDIHDADITVTLTVVYKNDRYDLSFDIKGEVVLICDRCLDDLHFPIDTTYHVVVEYGSDYNDDTDGLLILPASDSTLNVAYMIYDSVVLAIPMKHVHPMGKCNRQMSALLRKHRSRPQGEDAELEEALIDEMDTMTESGDMPTDPRWNALKGLNIEDE